MNKIQQTIQTIIETKTPQKINGVFVDAFTASMINTIANNLTEENRNRLYSMPVNKMVAISVKMLKVPSFTLNESAAEEAKKLGLEYFGFGRYGKDGKVTHKSKDGKLVSVDNLNKHQSKIVQSPHSRMGQKDTSSYEDDKLFKYSDEDLLKPENLLTAVKEFDKDILKTAHNVALKVSREGGNYSSQLYGSILDQLRLAANQNKDAKKLFLAVRKSLQKDDKISQMYVFNKIVNTQQPEADEDPESFDSQENLMKSILSISPEIIKNAQSASLSAKNSGEDGIEVFVSALMNGLDRYALRVGTSREQPMDKKALAAYERLERLYDKVRLRHKEMDWKSNKDER